MATQAFIASCQIHVVGQLHAKNCASVLCGRALLHQVVQLWDAIADKLQFLPVQVRRLLTHLQLLLQGAYSGCQRP